MSNKTHLDQFRKYRYIVVSKINSIICIIDVSKMNNRETRKEKKRLEEKFTRKKYQCILVSGPNPLDLIPEPKIENCG